MKHFFVAIPMLVLCWGCGGEPAGSKVESSGSQDAAHPQTHVGSQGSPSSTIDRGQNQADDDVGPGNESSPYISFPAEGVKLVRPPDFDDAENFHGFQQTDSGSSVMVVLIPGDFSEARQGFTADKLATAGMKLKSTEDVVIDGNKGVLVSVTQHAHGKQFSKWILAFGDKDQTRIITATFPRSAEAELSPLLKSVIVGAKTDGTPPPVPGADVGFTIVPSAKLKSARGLGKMLVYTRDGVLRQHDVAAPGFLAAPAISKVLIDDKKEFAERRLFQTAHTRIQSVTSINEIAIDGLDGFEIVADAEDEQSATPLTVYHVMLFHDDSYILIQCLVGASLADEYLPEFKSMARSLKRDRM